MNIRPAGPTTACLSLPTFLQSCLQPSCFPSCLHFYLSACLISYLLVYSPSFLSSYFPVYLPSNLPSYLPSRLSDNLSVYLPQPPTCLIQPIYAFRPSGAPQDSERWWAVGLGAGAGFQGGSQWLGVGVQLKH